MNIDQFQGIGTEEGSSQQDFNQTQPPETQQFPNQQQEEGEISPMQYVRENTPSNDPSVPPVSELPRSTPSQLEVSETEKDELQTVKSILRDILNKTEIKDYSVLPIDMTKPTFGVSNTSERSMIFPFGKHTIYIRFGLEEFKEALEKVISLDANTSILVYQSKRISNNGELPKPRYIKFTPEQIEVFKTAIANKEMSNTIPTEQPIRPVSV